MPQLVRKLIADDLKKRIDGFKRGPLQASVTLAAGHDYWWFQEFGTGSRGGDAEKWGLAPEDFRAPASVARHGAPGGHAYEIKGKRKKLFFFWKKLNTWVFVPGGAPAPRTAEGKQRRNWYSIPKDTVTHPGVRPRAILRRLLYAFRADVRLELMNMARRKDQSSVTLEEIARRLNKHLLLLRERLQAQTPRYVKPDPPEDFSPSSVNRHDEHEGGPLAAAWDVDLFDFTNNRRNPLVWRPTRRKG